MRQLLGALLVGVLLLPLTGMAQEPPKQKKEGQGKGGQEAPRYEPKGKEKDVGPTQDQIDFFPGSGGRYNPMSDPGKVVRDAEEWAKEKAQIIEELVKEATGKSLSDHIAD